ncbi:MAG: DUF1987 domain-containing protein, partial [Bacteroidales bacterium]|nr:DUF1987 domain-containing protein [Bacteroidales bacterium]
ILLESLYIEGSRKTPLISLDVSGKFRIEGRSIPEDASLFFSRVVEWIEKYLRMSRTETTIGIALEYLNSGTSKYILQILKLLKEGEDENHKLIVNWYYEVGDDDILERGEYFSTILDLDINFIETE